MLQKELAKRLRGRFETEPDGDGWLAVSSDRMPLCRVKYNGNCIVNDTPYPSEEYLGKVAEVQNDLLTVKEYVALYEHAPQMKAAEVLEYRQLAALYLLTADGRLWNCCKHHIAENTVFFEKIKLYDCSERAYTLYCAAKDLTLGTKHITASDLADADLVPPILFRTICNAMAIRRFGFAAIKEG